MLPLGQLAAGGREPRLAPHPCRLRHAELSDPAPVEEVEERRSCRGFNVGDYEAPAFESPTPEPEPEPLRVEVPEPPVMPYMPELPSPAPCGGYPIPELPPPIPHEPAPEVAIILM
jgi:hypothetical protein